MRLIGIGDLHLGSSLQRYIPGLDDLILDMVQTVVEAGKRKGATQVIFYGDVSHHPGRDTISDLCLGRLIDLFADEPDLTFHILKGNHDHKADDDNSLHALKVMAGRALPNLFVYDNESVVYDSFADTPIKFCPWPNTDTSSKALNVLHTECVGSAMDSGVQVTEGFKSKHFCVSGHLHTSQVVGRTHYSGTLHQTTFGESPDKFYHLIDWTGDPATSKVKLIPFQGPYRLENVVIDSQESLDAFRVNYQGSEGNPVTTYFKVFVNKRTMVLEQDPFGTMPRVVKNNSFRTKKELKAQLSDELSLELGDQATTFDTHDVFQEWLKASDVPPELGRRAAEKLSSLTKRHE